VRAEARPGSRGFTRDERGPERRTRPRSSLRDRDGVRALGRFSAPVCPQRQTVPRPIGPKGRTLKQDRSCSGLPRWPLADTEDGFLPPVSSFFGGAPRKRGVWGEKPRRGGGAVRPRALSGDVQRAGGRAPSRGPAICERQRAVRRAEGDNVPSLPRRGRCPNTVADLFFVNEQIYPRGPAPSLPDERAQRANRPSLSSPMSERSERIPARISRISRLCVEKSFYLIWGPPLKVLSFRPEECSRFFRALCEYGAPCL